MGVAGERNSARRHLSQCSAERDAAGGLAKSPQAHVVPALDHFADFDFVGIAYVCVSHRFKPSGTEQQFDNGCHAEVLSI